MGRVRGVVDLDGGHGEHRQVQEGGRDLCVHRGDIDRGWVGCGTRDGWELHDLRGDERGSEQEAEHGREGWLWAETRDEAVKMFHVVHTDPSATANVWGPGTPGASTDREMLLEGRQTRANRGVGGLWRRGGMEIGQRCTIG